MDWGRILRGFCTDLGGFGEASGWIWGGFGEGFGRIWRPGGAQMETKMNEFRGHFATPSQEPSRGGFGDGSGWIWECFGRVWNDFAKILNEI